MIFSLGFMNPRVLRGRSLSSSATASRVVLRVDGWSVPLGKYWRRSPLVFSLVPRCHGSAGRRSRRPCQRGADPFVQGEFRSLVPGQAVAQEFGQVLHLVDDGLLDVFGVVPVGQVQQDREPGGALDERADGALLRLPVMRSPSQWPRTARSSISGSLRDHGHGFAETGFAALAFLGSAGGSPLPRWRVSAPA